MTRIKLGVWRERLAVTALVGVAIASLYRVYWAPFSSGRTTQGSFFQFQKTAEMLRREPDPAKRENGAIYPGNAV